MLWKHHTWLREVSFCVPWELLWGAQTSKVRGNTFSQVLIGLSQLGLDPFQTCERAIKKKSIFANWRLNVFFFQWAAESFLFIIVFKLSKEAQQKCVMNNKKQFYWLQDETFKTTSGCSKIGQDMPTVQTNPVDDQDLDFPQHYKLWGRLISHIMPFSAHSMQLDQIWDVGRFHVCCSYWSETSHIVLPYKIIEQWCLSGVAVPHLDACNLCDRCFSPSSHTNPDVAAPGLLMTRTVSTQWH